MSTGQQLQVDNYLTAPSSKNTRSPRKKSPSVNNLTDQESLHSTASKPRRRKKATVRDLQDSEEVASQADAESTPDSHHPSPSRISTRQRAAKSPTPVTPQKLGKRKTGDTIIRADEESDEEELRNLARDIEINQSTDTSGILSEVTRSTSSMKASPKNSLANPVKRRKSEFPLPSPRASDQADNEPEPQTSRRKLVKPKNRRTTLHEVIEAGEANYSDFNPFQSGPEEEGSAGGSGKKPKGSRRQVRSSYLPEKRYRTPIDHVPIFVIIYSLQLLDRQL